MVNSWPVSSVLQHLGYPHALTSRSRAKCPLCDPQLEHPPSISHKDNLWICFRCGEKGNAVQLAQKILKCGWSDAVRALGEQPSEWIREFSKPRPEPPEARARRIFIEHCQQIHDLVSHAVQTIAESTLDDMDKRMALDLVEEEGLREWLATTEALQLSLKPSNNLKESSCTQSQTKVTPNGS